MNGFDAVVLVLAGVLAVVGLVKGLVRILIGVATLILAVMLAAAFHPELAARGGFTGWPDEALSLVAFGLIVVGVLVAGGIVGWLARRLLQVAMLGWVDRLAGGALGLLATLLVVGMVVVPLVAYAPSGGTLLDESRLAPWVVLVSDAAAALVPDRLSARYHERVERLRDRWERVTAE